MYHYAGTLRSLNWRLTVKFVVLLLALAGLLSNVTPTWAAFSSEPASNGQVVGALQFPNCPQAIVAPGTANLVYCTTQSSSNPDQFSINMIVSNQTSYDLDFSHTIVCDLQRGTAVSNVVASANNVAVSTVNNTLIWTPTIIPAGQTRNISFLITKAADSTVLIQTIKITGINQLFKSPFTAILTALQAKTETRVTPIDVGAAPNTPATGFEPKAVNFNLTWPFVVVLGGMCGVSMFWLAKRKGLWRLKK